MKYSTTIIILLFLSSTLFADVIYVTPTGGGSMDGSTWDDTFANLHDAISTASNGDEIWMLEGTYIPEVDRFGSIPTDASEQTYYINKNISIYGGFIGFEKSLSERLDPKQNPTVLNGQIDPSTKTYHVFWLQDATVLLDGVEIKNGHASEDISSSNKQYGGAIYGINVNLTLEQCIIRNNQAQNNGGAIYLLNGINNTNIEYQCFVHRCRFENNAATSANINGFGGAMSITSHDNMEVSIINSIFYGNEVDGKGGALYLNVSTGGTLNSFIYYCTFVDNISPFSGAAIEVAAASSGAKNFAQIWNTIFYNNTDGNGQFETFNCAERDICSAEIQYIITDDDGCSDWVTPTNEVSSCSNIGENLDPMFLNYPSGNFNLMDNSDAIENADLIQGKNIDVDYAGLPRPTSTSPDIGAYQYNKNVLAAEWVALNGTVKAQQILLDWQTLNEFETAFYNIEHSHNGRDFNKIGSVAANNNPAWNSYQFKHSPTTFGKHFYRIVQVAENGSKDISKIVAVDFRTTATKFGYPNPAHNQIYLQGNFESNDIIQFINSQGVIKKEIHYKANPIMVKDLPTGIYLLRIANDSWQQRIMISH